MFLGHEPEEDNVTIRNDDKAAEDRGNYGQVVGVGQGQVQEDASNIIVKIAEVVVKLVPPSSTSCKLCVEIRASNVRSRRFREVLKSWRRPLRGTG